MHKYIQEITEVIQNNEYYGIALLSSSSSSASPSSHRPVQRKLIVAANSIRMVTSTKAIRMIHPNRIRKNSQPSMRRIAVR